MPLETLGLAPGKIEDANEPNRPLPEAPYFFRAAREELPDFSPATERSPAPARKRIAALAPELCFTNGGCYPTRDRGEEHDCKIPCDVPPLGEISVAAPRFEPCPPGWIAGTRGAFAVCEPPLRLASDCPLGQVQPVDGSTCVSLGPPCDPTDPWNSTLAGRPGMIHYVDDDLSLTAALAIAVAGETIALAKGVYRGEIEPPLGVTLIGACPAETVIDGHVRVVNPDVKIESLRIENAQMGIDVEADVSIAGVVLIGSSSAIGIQIREGNATVEGLFARGWSTAIKRENLGGHLALRRAVITESSGPAVFAIGGRDVLIEDSVFTNGRARALLVQNAAGSMVTVERALFSGHIGQTINILLATAILRDIALYDAQPEAPELGDGIYLAFGNLRIERALIERHAHAAIWIFSAEGSFEDVVTHNISGNGFELQSSDGTITRAAILDSFAGVEVSGPKKAELTDVSIENTPGYSAPSLPGTVRVASQAELIANDLRIERVPEIAILAFPDSKLTLTGVKITGARSGVEIYSANAELDGLQIADIGADGRMPSSGLGAFRDTTATSIAPTVQLQDFRLERCQNIALDLSTGGSWTVKNGVISGNGLGARIDFDPRLGFEQVEIRENQEAFQLVEE